MTVLTSTHRRTAGCASAAARPRAGAPRAPSPRARRPRARRARPRPPPRPRGARAARAGRRGSARGRERAGSSPRFARLHARIMPLADDLPGDRRLAAVRLDGPRVRPARRRRTRYIDAATLARPGQRAAVLQPRLALADPRRPPVRPRRRGAAVHGTLRLLDEAGHPRRAGAARAAHRPRRDDPDVGPPGVGAAGVPPPALPVVASRRRPLRRPPARLQRARHAARGRPRGAADRRRRATRTPTAPPC